MLLAEPPRTDYDFEFNLLGFSVRVSVGFWIAAVVLGYGSAAASSQRGMVLLVWVAVLFISILVHELGHALAFRRFGVHSSIVLYHFGGLAIPRGSFRGAGNGSLAPREKIIVSFAGPAAQLVLAAMGIAFAKINGYALPWFLNWIPGLEGGESLPSLGMHVFLSQFLFINVFWSVMNLIPIWPLDGGQIAREVAHLSGGTVYHSSVLSIACCVIAAALALKYLDRPIFTLLFLGSFAYTNYQIMSSDFGRRW